MSSRSLKPFGDADFDIDPATVSFGNELGRGQFSRVYKGDFSGKTVALKQQELVDPDLERYLLNELAILRLVKEFDGR
jgi:predicted Ser/Thr protein kinase